MRTTSWVSRLNLMKGTIKGRFFFYYYLYVFVFNNRELITFSWILKHFPQEVYYGGAHYFFPLICFTKSYICNIKAWLNALFVNCSVTCCKHSADIQGHHRNVWAPEKVQWQALPHLIFSGGSGFTYYCDVSTVSQNRQTKVQ